ncbi:MAG TPA: FlgD immunoglobulin-like domain containing protein [Candidatus Cloacimonadota bacterium]|nr:FlgD immunoglobulin-like domain containing protein [Candidatus Cloacimonadota bacterium]HQL14331.1 FlgD immunoglobulin-like domain containing protein [Candidatus Cloacimonadota bacterium]
MRKIIYSIIAFLFINFKLFSVTNPTPQSLPYQQDFSNLSYTSTTYPDGWCGWILASQPGSSFVTSSATADKSLVDTGNASSTATQVYNYDGKIGFLNGPSGDLSIVLAINAKSKKNIIVQYDIMTIRNPWGLYDSNRYNEVILQYRIGTNGSFTNLTETAYQNNNVQQIGKITTPQNISTKTVTLPSNCNDNEIIQLRLASRQVSGSNLIPSFAIDNISVNAIPLAWEAPQITVSATSLIGFNYVYGNGPSTPAQSFFVSGQYLTGNLNLAAPADYEISLSPDSDFSSSLTLMPTNGTADTTSIYVRLAANREIGNYNDESIIINSNGAEKKIVSCGGYVAELIPDPPLSVELTSFTAALTEELFVNIQWKTQSESGLVGYYIYRGTTDNLETAERIPALINPANSSTEHNYEFIDRELQKGKTYYYWLQCLELNGFSDFHGPISVKVIGNGDIIPPANISETKLLKAYPNPFIHRVTLSYTLQKCSQVKLDIYNVKGQLIQSFSPGEEDKGYHQIFWDGTDLKGVKVSSDIYYLRMICEKYIFWEKLVILK